jgi:DNA primase
VRKSGREAFEKLAADAQPLSIFMLRELGSEVDRTSQEGRARLLQRAEPLVKQIPTPALGLLIRKQLAEMAGVTVAELNALYGERGEGRRAQRPVERKASRPSPEGNNYITIGACFLHRPELADTCELAPDWPASPALDFLRELLIFLKESEANRGFALIVQHFAGREADRFLEKAIAKQNTWNENWDIQSELDGALRQIRAQSTRTSLNPLLARDRAQAWSDEEERRFSQWQEEHRQLLTK